MIGRRDYCFSCPLYFFPCSRLSSYLLRLFFLISFHSCCSHARVFGKTLVHEFDISYSHTEWYLISMRSSRCFSRSFPQNIIILLLTTTTTTTTTSSGYYYYDYVVIGVLRPSWCTEIIVCIGMLLSK